MTATLDLQIACDDSFTLPKKTQFAQWVECVLSHANQEAELTIRLVNLDEMQQLNHTYRHQDKPTNVLSFPFEGDNSLLALPLLGDVIICPLVVAKEASAQSKSIVDHFAHMTIHGVLHLLGYDHIKDEEATVMEALEIRLLQSLGISNPYELMRPQ